MKFRRCLSVGIAAAALFACTSFHNKEIQENGITQVSTIDALLAGVYDGHLSLEELKTFGDFGIGTFEHLDGEMILLDGVVYQAKTDGSCPVPPDDMKTPFAAVTFFHQDTSVITEGGTGFKETEDAVNALAPNPNAFCAFRLDGKFRMMKTRSVPGQVPPYPPLAEVVKHQSVFDLTDVSGTLIGIRSPEFVKGVNVPGFHMHFISDDRQSGGHVLDFEVESGMLSADVHTDRLTVRLPSESRSFQNADLGRDRSRELEKVEKDG